MKIDKKTLDTYQLEYLTKAETLQSELIKEGFLATRIEKREDDRCTFDVIFFDGTHDYRVIRDYRNNVTLTRAEWKSYPNVSSHERSKVLQKYRTQNMRAITAKKLQAKIDAENAYHVEMEALNGQAVEKVGAFLEQVYALKKNGVDVKLQEEKESGKITGGYIVRGGLEYSFEVGQDGYISKKIRVSWIPETSLKNFMLLSDNKYTT